MMKLEVERGTAEFCEVYHFSSKEELRHIANNIILTNPQKWYETDRMYDNRLSKIFNIAVYAFGANSSLEEMLQKEAMQGEEKNKPFEELFGENA